LKSFIRIITLKKKPEKKCPECAGVCHARKSVCPCGYQFYEKARDRQRRLSKNWRGLKNGDVIRCVGGHGSYWLNKDTGEKVRQGVSHRGTFEVFEVLGDYIAAHQINKGRVKGAEREFIYMGKSELCKTTGVIHKESHKIVVLKKNES
jgi:hypothetical protein